MISGRGDRQSATTWTIAALAAAATLGCGEVTEGTGGVTSEEDAIIGGFAVSVATRRQLGLIDGPACSGALLTPDWVLTAAHCINFPAVSNMTFTAPRTDGGVDTRRGVYAIQAGSADLGMVRLAPGQPGNMWPNVSHPITTAAESSFINQNVTCYGRGDTAYDTDGVGTILAGTWKSLTKQIVNLVSDPILGDAYRTLGTNTPGTQVAAFGDSGGNCIASNGQAIAVLSRAECTYQGQGQPGDPGCMQSNVTSINANLWTATADFRSYLTEGLNRAATNFRPLFLVNGWVNAPFGANAAGINHSGSSGVITMRGAIASGTGLPFVVPSGFAPNARIYLPVSTVNNTIGRLVIETNGDVAVETETGLPQNARDFTSLDGVSYLVDSAGTTPLTLLNGWTPTAFGTRAPAVKVVNGFVRFQGALSNGTTSDAFTLPAGFRPGGGRTVYVPIDVCGAAKGRLTIRSDGRVTVHGENGFAWPQCFTSLEGASFAIDESNGTTSVALENGWGASGFNTGFVRFRNDGGVIRFQGATANGTSTRIFTLPPAFRPATFVWVPVDLFGGKRGRILVMPSGAVVVDPSSMLSDAQGFISFEGALFGI